MAGSGQEQACTHTVNCRPHRFLINALGARGIKYLDIDATLSKLDAETSMVVQQAQPCDGVPPAVLPPPAPECPVRTTAKASRNQIGQLCVFGCNQMLLAAAPGKQSMFLPSKDGVSHTATHCPFRDLPAGAKAPLAALPAEQRRAYNRQAQQQKRGPKAKKNAIGQPCAWGCRPPQHTSTPAMAKSLEKGLAGSWLPKHEDGAAPSPKHFAHTLPFLFLVGRFYFPVCSSMHMS
jgi:hypothetical protein